MAKTTDDTQTETLPAQPQAAPLDRLRPQAELRSIRDMSFDDALGSMSERSENGLVDASQAGIGYKLIEGGQKRHLVGVELMVLPGWRVQQSDKFQGRYFTSAYVKTRNPVRALENFQEFILNDGSTGIAQQLAELRQRCKDKGIDDPAIHCQRGLRLSEFTVTDDEVDDLGNPVIDPITDRPKQKPRLDPVTNEPIKGGTFYLDTTV